MGTGCLPEDLISRRLSCRIRGTEGSNPSPSSSESPVNLILDQGAECFIGQAPSRDRWPNGFACTVLHLQPNVGGTFKMSFRNFTTGQSHSFGGEYVELVPNERLRYTDKFDDPNLAGDIQVTVMLKKVSVGTEVNIVQEGLPDVIPLEACYLGWQESLRNLARLVEPEINQ